MTLVTLFFFSGFMQRETTAGDDPWFCACFPEHVKKNVGEVC